RVEDGDGVAAEELGLEPGVGTWRAADVGDRDGDGRRAAIGEARGLDLPAQARVGEVVAKGVQSSVENGHSGSSLALAMITSPKRSTKSAPSMVRLTSTLRRSSSSR